MTEVSEHERISEVARRAFEMLTLGVRDTHLAAARLQEALVGSLLSISILSIADTRSRLRRPVQDALRTLGTDPTWEGVNALLLTASRHHPTFKLFETAAKSAALIAVDRDPLTRVVASIAPFVWLNLAADRLGTMYESLSMVRIIKHKDGAFALTDSLARKRSGSHYTPRAIADSIARRALTPLLANSSHENILGLRIADPSMGGGAFLLAASRVVGDALHKARLREGLNDSAAALKDATQVCLRGVDQDAVAVEIARASLWIETGAELGDELQAGDALLDEALDWKIAFADVFARKRRSGFDAFVGNPPWISYVGRATQPLDPKYKKMLMARFQSFANYRNLQGVFIERCASLLASGGRLGLLIPSSMSEQSGYLPTREAHDRLCVCDADLPDLGDSFEGVFQPCMALLSTKREEPRDPQNEPWPVERPDLDDVARSIVRKMAREPFPAQMFGERGLQSFGKDVFHMKEKRDDVHKIAVRSGGDIRAFFLGPPTHYVDPSWFGSRLRPPPRFQEVSVLIRQTARVPTACLSDGQGFRNSILAGFAHENFSGEFLVAYLNSTPIRYFHYVRNRDARQGMPQVKIGHLRALPAPPDPKLVTKLHEMGKTTSQRNSGVSYEEQYTIDSLVADAFDLDETERKRLEEWTRDLK